MSHVTATHCNTLQHAAIHCNTLQPTAIHFSTLQQTATHCNTLQHDATQCKTLCNTLHYTSLHSTTPKSTEIRCNTLHHTAIHCKWRFLQNLIKAQPHGSKNSIVLYQEMWLRRWCRVSKLPSAATSQQFKWSGYPPGT